METPKYRHDCDNCLFLGRLTAHSHGWKDHRIQDYDLYVCARNGVADTVSARYGDEGSEYMSGLLFAHRRIVPELVEAKRRAEACGIDCSKEV